MQLYFNSHYVASDFAIETSRKSEWIARTLITDPIDGIDLASPAFATQTELQRVHAEDYVLAVKSGVPLSLATSQGFSWDARLWDMVTAANGGAVAAALAALRDGVAGSLSSGLHHARPECGKAFCTFNGLALAAVAALDTGVEHVLILDLDAHCGGGTAACVSDNSRIWQIDISTCHFDDYPKSERSRLEIIGRSANYLPCIRYHLEEVDRLGVEFGLCLYNAGMDPHEACGTGGMKGITSTVLAEREAIVFEWCRQRRLPVAFLLAGGYTGPNLSASELVALHRETITRASQTSFDRPT